ncbi:MAG: hypothetical protein H6736_00920 [Alphaproteobacteria bacterium]|nr:hypothetical protein [Alphaproteobacteria bacterium]MCB9690353.1 hypothetical protein [Alphaproteobacteria bacterium]
MLLALAGAWAQEGVVQQGFVRHEVAGRPILELRGGAQSTAVEQPVICLEGAPLSWLSLETCGNGAGILHQQPGYDMVHFRAKARALHRERDRTTLDLFGGLGLTEVQSTTDRPGFAMGRQEAGSVEAAGPSVAASAKGRLYATPGTYVVADASVGAAWIPGAPAVFGRGGPVTPFASVTVGLGF